MKLTKLERASLEVEIYKDKDGEVTGFALWVTEYAKGDKAPHRHWLLDGSDLKDKLRILIADPKFWKVIPSIERDNIFDMDSIKIIKQKQP